MTSKRPPNLRGSSITRELWDQMVQAYRDRPTIRNVQLSCNIGKKLARRAVMEGWPDLGFPALVEVGQSNKTVHQEMAKYRQSWEETAATQGEAARMAAEEAMAARISMDAALKAARLSQGFCAKVLERMEDNDGDPIEIPDITPGLISKLVKSLDTSASVVEKAMRIARMRAGEPEAALGMEIGILLERCNDDELSIVIKTGSLPDRIVETRRAVTAQLSVEGQTAAERKALSDGNGNGPISPATSEEDEQDQQDLGLELEDLEEFIAQAEEDEGGADEAEAKAAAEG